MTNRPLHPLSKIAAAVGLCLAALFLLAAGMHGAQKTKSAPAAGSLFAADKGKLKILVDGKAVGSEEFEIAPAGESWIARGKADILGQDGARVRVLSTLRLRPDGIPQAYEWSMEGGKKTGAHIVFESGVAKITLEMEGSEPFQQEMNFETPKIVVLDNNLFHQYGILARLYNWPAGGVQTFPVLIPQDVTPGSLKVESIGPRTLNGQSFAGLRIATADLEVFVYVDGNHRLMQVEVPSAKASIVRE
ncbi:MAG: hypothetical protein LAN71_14730 [Acidobacteriia bacterium]|nr:hypothetical protein [Terriglobia bacterium]